MSEQPKALRLADALDCHDHIGMSKAAAELRRLHSVNAELLASLKEVVAWMDHPSESAFSDAQLDAAKAAIAKAQE